MKKSFAVIFIVFSLFFLSSCSETNPPVSREELDSTVLPPSFPDPTQILPPTGCIKNCDNPLFDIIAPTHPWEIKRGVYTNVPVNLAIYDGGNGTLARFSAKLVGSSNSNNTSNLSLLVRQPTFNSTVPFKVYTKIGTPKDLWFVEFFATYKGQTQEFRMFLETK